MRDGVTGPYCPFLERPTLLSPGSQIPTLLSCYGSVLFLSPKHISGVRIGVPQKITVSLQVRIDSLFFVSTWPIVWKSCMWEYLKTETKSRLILQNISLLLRLPNHWVANGMCSICPDFSFEWILGSGEGRTRSSHPTGEHSFRGSVQSNGWHRRDSILHLWPRVPASSSWLVLTTQLLPDPRTLCPSNAIHLVFSLVSALAPVFTATRTLVPVCLQAPAERQAGPS